MAIDVTWTTAQIRGGKNFRHYGDPYESSAMVSRVGGTAYISGWVGPPIDWREMFDKLRVMGCTEVAWERKKYRKSRWARFSLAAPISEPPSDAVTDSPSIQDIPIIDAISSAAEPILSC